MSNALLKQLLEIGLPILVVLLSTMLARVLNALHASAKTKEWKLVLEILEQAVRTAVDESEQTTVPVLKSIGTPGKLDDWQRAMVRAKTVDHASKIAGSKIMRAVKRHGVDARDALGAMVESHVISSKRDALRRQALDALPQETTYQEPST